MPADANLISPEEYRRRWTYDTETGALVPSDLAKAEGSKRPQMPVVFRQEGNTQVAYLKELAVGDAVFASGSITPQYYDVTTMANWDYTPQGTVEQARADMAKAVEYWREDELVYKCVTLLTQMCSEAIVVECEDEDFRDVVEIWLKTAMPMSFREQWFREYWRTSFVPAAKTLVPYRPREYKYGKIPQTDDDGSVIARAADREAAREEAGRQLVERNGKARKAYEEAAARLAAMRENFKLGIISEKLVNAQAAIVVEKQYEWLQGMVPAAYTILDPMTIEMKGPKEMEILRMPFMKVSEELRAACKSPTPQQQSVLAVLPVEIIEQIRRGADEVWLSPNICKITFGDKQDYERYPTPKIRHAFKALAMKKKLQEADERTADSVRDRILKVTIGSDAHPVLNQESLVKLAALFRNRSRSMTLFWNHTLEIEWIEPPLESFLDAKRYQLCDDRIRTCFGIGRIFTGTSESAGAIGNSVMNFKGLEEEVNHGREAFIQFADGEVDMLKQALGIGHQVVLRFPRFSLSDPLMLLTALSTAVLNGVIDARTALETLSFHFPTVAKRMKEIKKIREKDGIFVPLPSANNLGPDGGIIPSTTGGKPAKQAKKSNQQKKGKSQPKKKAKARFMMPAPDDVRLVFDSEVITDEEREALAETFGVPKEWLMTSAAYKEAFGEQVTFVEPWPSLEGGEILAAGREARDLMAKVEAAIEEELAAAKKLQGGRGPYATPKVKMDWKKKKAKVKADEMKIDDPDYAERLRQSIADLTAADPQMDEDERLLTAACILKRRHAKIAAALDTALPAE